MCKCCCGVSCNILYSSFFNRQSPLSHVLPSVPSLQKFECPTNGICRNATRISEVPFEAEGGTNDFSPAVGTTGAATCPAVEPSTKGSWFKLDGDGSCYVASVGPQNSLDTVIAIYVGSPSDCQNLACYEQNFGGQIRSDSDDSDDDVPGTRRLQFLETPVKDTNNEVLFETNVGVTYYILVAGYSGASIVFDFKLEERECPSIQENDACVNATSIASLPFAYAGDLFYATPDDPSAVNATPCVNSTDDDEVYKTVWFDYVSTGNDTCVTSQLISKSSASRYQIFDGTSCSSLSCVKSDLQVTDDEEFSWRAKGGVRYWLRVASPQAATSPLRDEGYALRVKVSCVFLPHFRTLQKLLVVHSLSFSLILKRSGR